MLGSSCADRAPAIEAEKQDGYSRAQLHRGIPSSRDPQKVAFEMVYSPSPCKPSMLYRFRSKR